MNKQPLTTESRTGETPNGGVRSVIHYRDIHGNPVDKEFAVRAEIIEFDANDNVVGRTYGSIDR